MMSPVGVGRLNGLDVLDALRAANGWERRVGQDRVAEVVTDTLLRSGRDGCVLAPVGTGKSFGYLAPLAALTTDPASGIRRVLVSTGTRTLQRQLEEEDLPALHEVFDRVSDREFRSAVLYGRANYPCHLKMSRVVQGLRDRLAADVTADPVAREAAKSNLDDPDVAVLLVGNERELLAGSLVESVSAAGFGKRYEWMVRDSGDVKTVDRRLLGVVDWFGREVLSGRTDVFPFGMGVEADLLRMESKDCLGEDCPFFEDCRLEQARARAAEAHVVVVNHTMLAMNAAGIPLVHGREKLGPVDAIVVDEAHRLPDEVRSRVQRKLSGRVFQLAVRGAVEIPGAMREAITAADLVGVSPRWAGVERVADRLAGVVDDLRDKLRPEMVDVWLRRLLDWSVQTERMSTSYPKRMSAEVAEVWEQRGGFADREVLLHSPSPVLARPGLFDADLFADVQMVAAICERMAEILDDAYVEVVRLGGDVSEVLRDEFGGEDWGGPVLDDPRFASLLEAMKGPVEDFAAVSGMVANVAGLVRREPTSWVHVLDRETVEVPDAGDVAPKQWWRDRLVSTPLDTDVLLNELVWTVRDKWPRVRVSPFGPLFDEGEPAPVGHRVPVVAVSGSMPVEVPAELGLRLPDGVVEVGSPFEDAYRRVRVFEWVPDSADRAVMFDRDRLDLGKHREVAAGRIVELASAMRGKGGVLVLATTTAAVDAYTSALRDAGVDVLSVSDDASEVDGRSAEDRFKAGDVHVLVGSKRLMTGFSAPGDACRMVVLDRVPRSPNNPVDDARAYWERQFEAASRGRFDLVLSAWDGSKAERYQRDAVVALEQAAGRLVRQVSDDGWFVMLDPRIGSGWYSMYRDAYSFFTGERITGFDELLSSIAADRR